jgi:hypothetical protein
LKWGVSSNIWQKFELPPPPWIFNRVHLWTPWRVHCKVHRIHWLTTFTHEFWFTIHLCLYSKKRYGIQYSFQRAIKNTLCNVIPPNKNYSNCDVKTNRIFTNLIGTFATPRWRSVCEQYSRTLSRISIGNSSKRLGRSIDFKSMGRSSSDLEPKNSNSWRKILFDLSHISKQDLFVRIWFKSCKTDKWRFVYRPFRRMIIS